jgi:hypothetical protein
MPKSRNEWIGSEHSIAMADESPERREVSMAKRRYYRNPPPSMYQPEHVSTMDTVILGGVMVGIIGIVGYALLSSKSAMAATTPATAPQLPAAPAAAAAMPTTQPGSVDQTGS